MPEAEKKGAAEQKSQQDSELKQQPPAPKLEDEEQNQGTAVQNQGTAVQKQGPDGQHRAVSSARDFAVGQKQAPAPAKRAAAGQKRATRAQQVRAQSAKKASRPRLSWTQRRKRFSQRLAQFLGRILGRSLQIYRRDRFLFIAALLSLLLLLPLAYALFFPHLDGAAKPRLESLHSLRFAVERSEANEYYPLTDNTILHVGDQSLRLLNAAGVEIRRYDFPAEKPFVLIRDGLAFVGEQDGYRYIVLDERRKHYEGKTKDPIKGASLARDGQAALILDQRSSFGLLRVLKADGSVNFDWLAQDRKQSGFIINSLFSEQGDNLYVSLYNSSSYNGHASIYRMRLSGDKRGQIERRSEIQEAGPLLFMAEAEQGSLFLADGQKLYKLGTDDQVQEQGFGRISTVIAKDGRCWALAEQGSERSLALVSWDGREEARVLGSERYTESARLESGLGSQFYLLHGRSASIYDSRKGQLIEQHNYDSPLIRAYLGHHMEKVLVTEDQVYLERN